MSAATDMLAAYQAAEAAILDGKTVRFLDQQVTLEDLDRIRAGRQEWERKVAAETRQAAGDYTAGRHQIASFSD